MFPGLWNSIVLLICRHRTFFSSGNTFSYYFFIFSSLWFLSPLECLFKILCFLDISKINHFFHDFYLFSFKLTTFSSIHALNYFNGKSCFKLQKEVFWGDKRAIFASIIIKSVIILLVFLLNLPLKYSKFKFHNLMWTTNLILHIYPNSN